MVVKNEFIFIVMFVTENMFYGPKFEIFEKCEKPYSFAYTYALPVRPLFFALLDLAFTRIIFFVFFVFLFTMFFISHYF